MKLFKGNTWEKDKGVMDAGRRGRGRCKWEEVQVVMGRSG